MKPTRAILATRLLSPLAGLTAADSSQPTIVVFLADDLGWGDTSPYGNSEIKTPHLARLAAPGVKFNQCYSATGVCSPSRSAILTGRTPYRNGVWQHWSGNHEAHLRTSEITYPKLLARRFHTQPDQMHFTEVTEPSPQGHRADKVLGSVTSVRNSVRSVTKERLHERVLDAD